MCIDSVDTFQLSDIERADCDVAIYRLTIKLSKGPVTLNSTVELSWVSVSLQLPFENIIFLSVKEIFVLPCICLFLSSVNTFHCNCCYMFV